MESPSTVPRHNKDSIDNTSRCYCHHHWKANNEPPLLSYLQWFSISHGIKSKVLLWFKRSCMISSLATFLTLFSITLLLAPHVPASPLDVLTHTTHVTVEECNTYCSSPQSPSSLHTSPRALLKKSHLFRENLLSTCLK